MGNIRELLINVVILNKPKVLLGLSQKCDKKSLVYLLQLKYQDVTRCSVIGILPEYALLVTAGCKASGTK
jgi:hypothetical protein